MELIGEKPFKVYWFDETGDVEFAQSVIDAANPVTTRRTICCQ
jgi:hypothetical protein